MEIDVNPDGTMTMMGVPVITLIVAILVASLAIVLFILGIYSFMKFRAQRKSEKRYDMKKIDDSEWGQEIKSIGKERPKEITKYIMDSADSDIELSMMNIKRKKLSPDE